MASSHAGRLPPECFADFADSTGFAYCVPSANREKFFIEEGFPQNVPTAVRFVTYFPKGKPTGGFLLVGGKSASDSNFVQCRVQVLAADHTEVIELHTAGCPSGWN